MKYFVKGKYTLEQVKAVYKEQAKLHHPDKGGEVSAFQELNNEYRELLEMFKNKAKTKAEKEQFDNEINSIDALLDFLNVSNPILRKITKTLINTGGEELFNEFKKYVKK